MLLTVLDAICQNKSIERLQFESFFTIRLISDKVLHSKTLKKLFLYSLWATSGDILSFADSLMVNNSVKILHIDYMNNKIKSAAVLKFLKPREQLLYWRSIVA